MQQPTPMSSLVPVLAAAVLLGGLWGTPAQAQWQWVDKNGHPVFSDRPPPPDVPARDIRKQPVGRSVAQPPPTSPAHIATPGAGSSPRIVNAAPPATTHSGDDPALTARKRQAEQAEVAKQRAEEARVDQLQADSCARARQAKAGLDVGLRVARTNAQGEREFLDETGIAAEKQRIDAVIAADCK